MGKRGDGAVVQHKFNLLTHSSTHVLPVHVAFYQHAFFGIIDPSPGCFFSRLCQDGWRVQTQEEELKHTGQVKRSQLRCFDVWRCSKRDQIGKVK